ncbi:MAG: motility associated factor glycosyltransferase family protein [Lachnospiraceae bacterium]|jgi:hypothetical protein|nr:motility associated factor glycosyltransferase family protein [Lachnospiraceae bacterium]
MVECCLEKARNGASILYLKSEEHVWRLNSSYAPEKEAERWASQYQIQSIETPICLFGLGSGYFLRALLKKAKEDTIFIVVEPDKDVYEQVKRECQLEELSQDKRVHILVGLEEKKLTDLFYQYIDWKNIRSAIYCIHPHYEEIYQEEYLAYLKIIRDCKVREESVIATNVVHGTKRAENMLKALQLLPQNSVLKRLPEELTEQVPFMIIAAGPSLAQNIGELKKAEGKAILLAVDRAVPILKEHGIQPDLAITLDPVKNPDYLGETGKIPLLCNFASNKKTMELHKENLIFYGGYGYVKKLFDIINKTVPGIDTGGSVATAAMTVCMALRIKKVILVGQDLAFKDGKTHADDKRSDRNMDLYSVEGVDGTQIQTRRDWYIFLRWFEQVIQQNTWMHVIDATEGGARIQGTELRKLSEVLEELPLLPLSVPQLLEKIRYRVTEEEYQMILRKIENDILELKEIREQAREAEELIEQLLKACRNKSIDEPKYGRQIKKLGVINEKMGTYEILPFLDYYAEGESQKLLQDIYYLGENDMENKEKTYRQTKEFYKMYQDSSEKLEKEMQKILPGESE